MVCFPLAIDLSRLAWMKTQGVAQFVSTTRKAFCLADRPRETRGDAVRGTLQIRTAHALEAAQEEPQLAAMAATDGDLTLRRDAIARMHHASKDRTITPCCTMLTLVRKSVRKDHKLKI